VRIQPTLLLLPLQATFQGTHRGTSNHRRWCQHSKKSSYPRRESIIDTPLTGGTGLFSLAVLLLHLCGIMIDKNRSVLLAVQHLERLLQVVQKIKGFVHPQSATRSRQGQGLFAGLHGYFSGLTTSHAVLTAGQRRGGWEFAGTEVLQQNSQLITAASHSISLQSTFHPTLLPFEILLSSELHNFYIVPDLLSDNSFTTFLKYLISFSQLFNLALTELFCSSVKSVI
jgi:hypothetical protein